MTGEDLINALLKPLGTNLKHYMMTPKQEAMSAANAFVAERKALLEALTDIAEATSAEDDAGENYRWDDREGALDYAYAIARTAIAKAIPQIVEGEG